MSVFDGECECHNQIMLLSVISDNIFFSVCLFGIYLYGLVE